LAGPVLIVFMTYAAGCTRCPRGPHEAYGPHFAHPWHSMFNADYKCQVIIITITQIKLELLHLGTTIGTKLELLHLGTINSMWLPNQCARSVSLVKNIQINKQQIILITCCNYIHTRWCIGRQTYRLVSRHRQRWVHTGCWVDTDVSLPHISHPWTQPDTDTRSCWLCPYTSHWSNMGDWHTHWCPPHSVHLYNLLTVT